MFNMNKLSFESLWYKFTTYFINKLSYKLCLQNYSLLYTKYKNIILLIYKITYYISNLELTQTQ